MIRLIATMRWLPAALLLYMADTLAAERALRFSVSESWAMPMIRIEQGQAVGGILFDLHTRLAQKVGRQAEQLVLPRLRIQQMLVRGELDVRCYVNPSWLTESHHQYIWSVPFMVQRDLLVARTAQPVTTDQLHDTLIGTVLGFTYPTLTTRFDSGDLRRDDARTQELALTKLGARRYDYAISNELSLHWFNRHQTAPQRLMAVQELAADVVACIVRDEPDVPTMPLLRALVQMKQAGEFDAILARYR